MTDRSAPFRESIGSPIESEMQPPPTIADIRAAVCAHYGLPALAMAAQRRSIGWARPRQVAMFLARELTPRSFPEIGRQFGGRDHTTVMHAARRIEELRRSDRRLDADVRALTRELSNPQRQGLAQHEGA